MNDTGLGHFEPGNSLENSLSSSSHNRDTSTSDSSSFTSSKPSSAPSTASTGTSTPSSSALSSAIHSFAPPLSKTDSSNGDLTSSVLFTASSTQTMSNSTLPTSSAGISQPTASFPNLTSTTTSPTIPSSANDSHHDLGTLTSTTTLIVTMTIPLGTTTSGTLEWSTTVQTILNVQLNVPSTLNLLNSKPQGFNNSAVIGVVFGVISFVLLLFAGMFIILRRHFKKKYSKDRLPHFEKSVRQALEGRGPYSPTIAQVGISHLRQDGLGSLEDLSEETAVRSPILEYRHGRNSPVEVPQLYTDQTSLSTASSFVTVSSVPVPFYQRIKEARRAGTVRKYTM